jgi:hypothetical protein
MPPQGQAGQHDRGIGMVEIHLLQGRVRGEGVREPLWRDRADAKTRLVRRTVHREEGSSMSLLRYHLPGVRCAGRSFEGSQRQAATSGTTEAEVNQALPSRGRAVRSRRAS